jgi:hypothetical protein
MQTGPAQLHRLHPQQAASHLPAMVYVLYRLTANKSGWIVRTVEAGIPIIMPNVASVE